MADEVRWDIVFDAKTQSGAEKAASDAKKLTDTIKNSQEDIQKTYDETRGVINKLWDDMVAGAKEAVPKVAKSFQLSQYDAAKLGWTFSGLGSVLRTIPGHLMAIARSIGVMNIAIGAVTTVAGFWFKRQSDLKQKLEETAEAKKAFDRVMGADKTPGEIALANIQGLRKAGTPAAKAALQEEAKYQDRMFEYGVAMKHPIDSKEYYQAMTDAALAMDAADNALVEIGKEEKKEAIRVATDRNKRAIAARKARELQQQADEDRSKAIMAEVENAQKDRAFAKLSLQEQLKRVNADISGLDANFNMGDPATNALRRDQMVAVKEQLEKAIADQSRRTGQRVQARQGSAFNAIRDLVPLDIALQMTQNRIGTLKGQMKGATGMDREEIADKLQAEYMKQFEIQRRITDAAKARLELEQDIVRERKFMRYRTYGTGTADAFRQSASRTEAHALAEAADSSQLYELTLGPGRNRRDFERAQGRRERDDRTFQRILRSAQMHSRAGDRLSERERYAMAAFQRQQEEENLRRAQLDTARHTADIAKNTRFLERALTLN